MVVGQGEWRPPSTHRRLRNADCVQKFPPTPAPRPRRSVLSLPSRIKSRSPLPEIPYEKNVELQKKEAVSLAHRDGDTF